MLMRSVVLIVVLAICGGIDASAVTDSRPDGITGETWQFGPLNRWAYTHIREILPTKNIANDNNLVQPIPGLFDAKDDFSINLGGKTVHLSDSMKSQYVDGILVINLINFLGGPFLSHSFLSFSVIVTFIFYY